MTTMPDDTPPPQRKAPLHRRLLKRAFGGEASGVFRGMAKLATGSGIAKIFGILSLPILTRLFSPEDFGALAMFNALISILMPVLTLRYVSALPLPRQDGTALNLLAASFLLMIVVTALLFLPIMLLGDAAWALIGMDVLAPYWWLLVIGLFAVASYDALTMWATRQRAYGVIARTTVSQSFSGAVVKLLLGALALSCGRSRKATSGAARTSGRASEAGRGSPGGRS